MQKKIARKIASITAVSLIYFNSRPHGGRLNMIINQMGTIKNLRRSKRRGITLSWLRN